MTADSGAPPGRILVEFTVTGEDMVRATRASLGQLVWAPPITSAAAALGTLGAYLLTGEGIALVFAMISMGLMAGSGFLPELARFGPPADGQPPRGAHVQLELAPSGLRLTKNGDTKRVEWQSVIDWRESDGAIVLLKDGGTAASIPTRGFKTASDLDAARALIAANVKPAPRSHGDTKSIGWYLGGLLATGIGLLVIGIVAG